MKFDTARQVEGHRYPVDIADTYFQKAGACAFLVLNGPSLADSDRDLLSRKGVITAGVNNGPAHFRPNFWFTVDHPARFLASVWMDPGIVTFVGDGKADTQIRDEVKWNAAGNPAVGDFKTEGTPAWEINQQVAREHKDWSRPDIKTESEKRVREWHAQFFSHLTVGDCPNTVFCNLDTAFNPATFLTEPCFNMGNHKDGGGGRSVMLFALKTLFVLGFRRVFLVGCDWWMGQGYTYGFKEKRHTQAINNNNTTFGRVLSMFVQAQDHFKEEGFRIENCNPGSFLTCFPYRSLADAVGVATRNVPQDEVTEDRYGFKL